MTVATVRRMRPGEEPAVAALVLLANEEHLAHFPAELAAPYRDEIADVAGRLGVADVYVAELDGRIVGTVTYVRDAAHDGHPWPPGGAVVRFLAVAPDVRGQGLGRRLTSTCVERARSAGVVFVGLHTAPVMAAARHTYEQLGFERTPEHDFDPAAHYGGDDAGATAPGSLRGLAYVLRLDRTT